jgi:hypothetical protein
VNDGNRLTWLFFLVVTVSLGACGRAGDEVDAGRSQSPSSTSTQTEAPAADADSPLAAELTDDAPSIVDGYLADLGLSYESVDTSQMLSPPQDSVPIIESYFSNPDSSVRPTVTRLQPIVVMATSDEETPRAITPGQYWVAEIGGLPLPAAGFSPDGKPEPALERAVTVALLRDDANKVAITITRTWPAGEEGDPASSSVVD